MAGGSQRLELLFSVEDHLLTLNSSSEQYQISDLSTSQTGLASHFFKQFERHA